MTARLIDGKAYAAGLRERVAGEVAAFRQKTGMTPGLAVVLVGEDPASQVYVRNKGKAAKACGMRAQDHRLAAETDESELLALVARLNADPAVHGILVQMPLPGHLTPHRVVEAIDPAKDVDGLHPVNAGRLAQGRLHGADGALIACTPHGALMLLRDQLGALAGAEALVIGRSILVGLPMARLLIAENCTVTVAHSKTRELPDVCRRADILVAAAGRPGLVGGGWIKPGATVIDVGINRVAALPGSDKPYRLAGDVVFDEAAEVAAAITPVPGGVGPMTIACLMANTLTAACRQAGAEAPEWLG